MLLNGDAGSELRLGAEKERESVSIVDVIRETNAAKRTRAKNKI